MASAIPVREPQLHRGGLTLSAVHRYFELSLYLLLATSVLTLVSTGKLDPISTVLPPLALAIKGIRYWRGSARLTTGGPEPEISHRAATWLTVAYLVFFPFDLWVLSRGWAAGAPNPALFAALLAAIHLMLYAMVVRLFSARTTRDHMFLAMLAFAMMLCSAILTVDTAFLVFFLLFLVLAVSTFVGLEIRRSAEGAVAPPLATGTPAARRLEKALGATSVVVAFSALVLGAAIFFIIPRFTAGYLSGLNLQPSLISGFTDNVELGQIGLIKKNTAVVMRVRVAGPPERAANVRWRGIALTTFDGRRWYTEEHEPIIVTPASGGWYYLGGYAVGEMSEQLFRNSRELRYTVLLEPMATDAIFATANVVAVTGRFSSEGDRLGRPSRRSYLLLDKTRSLSNPFHNFTKILYQGRSYVPAVPAQMLRAAPADYPAAVRDENLQLPELDPRIPQLARQITANATNPYDQAAALEQHLRTKFGYTLDLSGSPPPDPLAYFLFERREGHCEYFAAAMTVMLRTLGIPARYVNGFLPGEYNDVGEDFIIRASDAHSWVEAYFPGYGWISFDPTPPADERRRGLLGRITFYWDWFELMWSEWVINYDFIHQVSLAQNFQRVTREWSEQARRYLQRKRRQSVEWLKQWQRPLLEMGRRAPGTVAAIGVFLLLAAALLLRRRAVWDYLAALAAAAGWRIGTAEKLTPRLATFYYQQMLRLLARRGMHKAPAQTPLEFAASVGRVELAAPVGQLTELYQSARFGSRPADAHEMSHLVRAIKELLRPRT